jgi:hypothetical protein
MPLRLLSPLLRRAIRICVAALGALAASPQPRAQTILAPNPNRTVNLNYVYAADLGFGGYSLAGLSASVYTLPLSYTLPNLFWNGWAVRLLAPVQGGLYSFRATDTSGQRLSLNQQSLSVVPGAEVEIPIGERVVLKPFAQVGVVHTFGSGVGNPDSWVYLAGARAITQWRSGAYTYSIGNGVLFAGDKTLGRGFNEHYVALQVGGEVRRPLGFKIGEWAPDLGLYAGTYYYPEPLVFSRFLRRPLRVANQGEIAFSIGSATPLHLLGLSNPRIGVGYVFGDGLNVWHANFGFPF